MHIHTEFIHKLYMHTCVPQHCFNEQSNVTTYNQKPLLWEKTRTQWSTFSTALAWSFSVCKALTIAAQQSALGTVHYEGSCLIFLKFCASGPRIVLWQRYVTKESLWTTSEVSKKSYHTWEYVILTALIFCSLMPKNRSNFSDKHHIWLVL